MNISTPISVTRIPAKRPKRSWPRNAPSQSRRYEPSNITHHSSVIVRSWFFTIQCSVVLNVCHIHIPCNFKEYLRISIAHSPVMSKHAMFSRHSRCLFPPVLHVKYISTTHVSSTSCNWKTKSFSARHCMPLSIFHLLR